MERQPGQPLSEDLGGENNGEEVSIEPKKYRSLAAAAEAGRAKFNRIILEADTRSLVRYIEAAGTLINDLEPIPAPWREYFNTKEFRNRSYTWINPKLCLLTDQSAATLALAELMTRLQDKFPLDSN